MLTQIYIHNVATIEEVNLQLQHGSTMITGETGAGKSIFIEAIELALGNRLTSNVIRPGKDKAEICLCFDITNFPQVIERLKQSDLYRDNRECMIRRTITLDSRTRSYVNGSPVPLHVVKELGELLFHLHAQHEQQVLLKLDTQRDMLDRFADHLELAAQVKTLSEEWRAIDQKIQSIRKQLVQHHDRKAYLQLQLTEFETLNIQAGEWESLESEHRKLTHSEELLRTLQHAIEMIEGNDKNYSLFLKEIRKMLESIQTLEPKVSQWLSVIDSIWLQLSDLGSELQHYLETTDLDFENMQAIEERIAQIFNLSRKFKTSPQALIAFQNQLHTEFEQLNVNDGELTQLETRQHAISANHAELAEKLSVGRRKAASKLEKAITATIQSLSLPYADFKIEFEPYQEISPPSLHGNERVQFFIKTNPDQPLQPIAKVVSGGELSRLSLAAHLALAHKTNIPTLVFDEVDSGLSGAPAERIGKLLRQLGNSYQVFCVTHQAQVAACGHHHLLVEKSFIDKSTYTNLRLLTIQEKTQEIARLLGGEKITAKTLAHAKEVLLG